MTRLQVLRNASLLLPLLAGISAGTEIEVTFEGEVILTEFHGFARGQPVSGRVLYDHAAAAIPGAPEFLRVYPSVLSFEVRVGDTEYAMTNGPGELTLFEGDPEHRYIILRSEPAGVLGPPMAGFSPLSLNLILLASSPAVVPGLALDAVALEYSLADFVNEPGESGVGIQFQSGDEVTTGVSITLRSLRARPFLPAFSLGRAIRLEDIVASGDGSHNAPPVNVGIDPRTGAFTTTYFAGPISDTDGVYPSPVPGSPYIDSVFLLRGRVPTSQDGCGGCFVQYTTQSGVQLWLDDVEETNSGYNYILKNRVGGISEPGIRVGGLDSFTSSIGLHASAGITFDLDELRARHGEDAVGCFSAFWGMNDCGSGQIRLLAMVSNDTQGVTDIRNVVFGPGQGSTISIPIPASAQYLTLASASVNGDITCDTGTIARPIITPAPCSGVFGYGWIWNMLPSRVAPGGESILIEGEGLFSAYTIRVGGVDLPDQVYQGDTLRPARVPPLSPGIYDAEIIWDFFGSNLIDRFPGAIEVAPPPVITAVSPDQVLIDRPMLCRFMGQNLRSDMVVFVPNSDQGASRLLHQEFHSPELITGYIPRPVPPQLAIAGTDVVYIGDQGRLREFPVGLLYVEIGVEKVVPDLVSTAGGTVVTVEGLGFEPGMTFRVGSSPLLDLEVIDSAHARGRTPPIAAGLHPVSMVLSDGHVFRTVPGLVEALPSPSPHITGVVPLTVSTRGGDLVAILTDVWHGGATPRIGGTPLSNIDGTELTLLRGESPPLAPGFHAVDLIGLDGALVSRIEGAIEAVNPAGIDLEPGDIIAGYVPVTSSAIHEGLTYLVKLEGERPRSCLATAPGDRTYLASPATLADAFSKAAVQFEMPNSAVETRLSSELVQSTGNTRCDLAEVAGGAGGAIEEQGGGGFFDPLIDIELPPMEVITWEDGPNYVHAGFHRLKVRYATGKASLGLEISGLDVKSVEFFSGLLSETKMVIYVDAHYEEHRREEKKVFSLSKHHLVILGGVLPIHFAATGELYAGVDLDAEVNLYASAGGEASFIAGMGMRHDGSRFENLSTFSPPTFREYEEARAFDLNGSVAVKGYVRPKTNLFAGILFRGLTADLEMRGEAFVRLHAAGQTQPVPCFNWGIDAGMSMTLVPEIQLFGMDLFDETHELFNEEEPVVGGRLGCKFPPVPSVTTYVVALGGDRYEVHLDASGSRDPDGGPLRFRWDFDADGQCDRATLGDPRTTVVLENVCPPFEVGPFQGCLAGRAMVLRVTDDEGLSVELPFKVVLRQ